MATKKPIVAVAAADSYDEKIVSKAVYQLFELLGSPAEFVTSEQKVLLKPNLLLGAEPERSVSTHPSVVQAVADVCFAQEANVTLIDSPGSGIPWNEKSLRKVYDQCGMNQLIGVDLSYNMNVCKVASPKGVLIKHFDIIEEAQKTDIIISLAKAKTHTFTGMTGAVKNLFGLVPGFDKPGYHARMRNTDNFSEMLVDLAELIKPKLTVVDAIVGMEGDGPNAGSPRNMGFLLASTDVYALDVVISHVMGINPNHVPTIFTAVRRGLTTGTISDIQLLGDKEMIKPIADFALPQTYGGSGFRSAGLLTHIMEPLIHKMLVLYPTPKRRLCTGCGSCVSACPNYAITIEHNKAKINRSACIRCYCCHEVCPQEAMRLKGSILYKIFHKIFR
ncbi:MAG: DUF362 domain-containing protein [Planctomycetota bacterium]